MSADREHAIPTSSNCAKERPVRRGGDAEMRRDRHRAAGASEKTTTPHLAPGEADVGFARGQMTAINYHPARLERL